MNGIHFSSGPQNYESSSIKRPSFFEAVVEAVVEAVADHLRDPLLLHKSVRGVRWSLV